MRTSREYRYIARMALNGKWNSSAVFSLLYWVVVMGAEVVLSFIPFIGSLFAWLAMLPIGYGFYVAFLRQLRGEVIQPNWLFENFNGRVWPTMILMNIYIFLWSLLLIVPGIIKTYSYSMTYYILRDDPMIDNNAAIERSMAMMDGHKWELFVLDLSFIGWLLLSILTCGIGFLWLAPYWQTARSAFYEDLKNQM